MPKEGFAEHEGCSRLSTNIEVVLDCTVICHIEQKESCVSFYFNNARKECRVLLFADATMKIGDARGWKKFVVKK